MDSDLSPDIKAFARENEREIKASAMQMMMEYFDSSICEMYEGKWDQGVVAYGIFTEDKLNTVNWVDEMTSEFKDAFWYQALLLYRKQRETQE